MKTIFQHMIVITVLVNAGFVLSQSDPYASATGQTDPYAEGLVAEERHQDYAKAAEYYASVIQEFDAQRQEAAHAIFRLGECLRGLGRIEAAKVQYARILREFPDFVPLTKQSHTRLTNPNKVNNLQQGSQIPLDLGDAGVQAVVDTGVVSKSEQVARMETARSLVLEILIHAGNHDGSTPKKMDDVIQALKKSASDQQSLDRLETYGSQFELVQSGKLDELSGILIKENRMWKNSTGDFAKVYGFTDGSVHVITRPTSDALLEFEGEKSSVNGNLVKSSQGDEVHALDIEMLKKHGLVSETSANEMKSIQRFLGDMGIELPVRLNSKYQVYGVWFNQGDFQKFDRVARSLYQNQEEEPSDALTHALLIHNDVENVSVENFDLEMKKLEKVFLPLLPQFLSDKAKQAWPNIASPDASQTEGLYFTILGQVVHPDVYDMQPNQPIGIVEAIAKAGGFTQTAKQNRISLFRNGEEKHFDFKELLKRKDLGDAKVKSGDRIVVPENIF